MASYSFNWNTITFTEGSDGVITATIPLEGTAEGFGVVFGTMQARGAGTTTGTYEMVAMNFPESGDQVIARGSGDWQKVGQDKWTSQGTADLTNGDTIKADGVFDLVARTWSGNFD
jgi:hypothetical protein